MPKKKIKTKRIHFLVDDQKFKKLTLCAGEYNTITDILNYAIDGYYYAKFKTNEVPDLSIKQNSEVIKQIQKQNDSISQSELEDAKAAFIARRNARKVGVSND